MPRVIVKCRYYPSGKSLRDVGGMLRYIAMREGVDKYKDGWKTEPASKAQMDLIQSFVQSNQSVKRMASYHNYINAKTKGAASEFISAALESYPELLTDKTYLDYIATRPRVERVAGTHGLFSEEGVALDLSAEAKHMREHKGNVFTVIVSLKREDAERLGYNNAEQWIELIRSKIDLIAKAHNIPNKSLKWYGAFHNESHHPHIHLMMYSTDPCFLGRINKNGIDKLRHLFGTEIFRDDLKQIYDNQTAVRNKLNADAADEIEELAEKIRTGLASNGAFVLKFVALAKQLQTVKGKKVYGYLPVAIKKEVCELVDILEEDEDIARMYELWYQAKCAVYNTYTDNNPIKKPLSQEESFKPIRNALIREADELGREFAEMALTLEAQQTTKRPSDEPYSASSANASRGSTNLAVNRNVCIAKSIIRFGSSISKTFRENFYDRALRVPSFVDSRLLREIEAKKRGQNLSM